MQTKKYLLPFKIISISRNTFVTMFINLLETVSEDFVRICRCHSYVNAVEFPINLQSVDL